MQKDDEITYAAPIHDVPNTTVQPRAQGRVAVSTKLRDGRSVLGNLRQSGSLKCLFPRVAGSALQAVMVNTAGGVTGGDRFDLEGHATAGTSLTLTTQTAERAYRAQPGQTGHIHNQLRVEDGARLSWLPQETILFDGSDLSRRLSVDLEGSAKFLLVEPLVFGRAAMNEHLNDVLFQDRIEITRDGTPLFLDATTLRGDIEAHLSHPAIADGAGAMVLMVYIAPDAASHLDAIRSTLPETAGVSLIRDDTLILRGLAEDSFALRQFLIPALTRLNGADLPRPWTI